MGSGQSGRVTQLGFGAAAIRIQPSVLLALMYSPTEDQKHWNIFIRMQKYLYLGINIIRSDEDEKIHERDEGSKTRVCVECPDDLHFFRISFWADFIFLVLVPKRGEMPHRESQFWRHFAPKVCLDR